MTNKIQYILITLIVVITISAIYTFIGHTKPGTQQPIILPTPKTKLQLCPDEWIDDQAPGGFSDQYQRQYFILNGERREIEEFDMEWIQENCNLEKQVVW